MAGVFTSMGRKIVLCTAAVTASAASVAGAVKAEDYDAYYSVVNAKRMALDWRAFYRSARQRTAATRREVPHRLNLSYGKDAKQKLDLYLPAKRTGKATVLLFIHGGSFMEGDRADYGYIARDYARRGVVVAIASYRLTGAGFRFPAQRDDARLAVAWLYRNIARMGGDPEGIVVSGHSAGAILAADIGVDRTWMTVAGIPRSAVKAIVGVSGKYRLGPDEKLFANYASGPEMETLASPIARIDDPVPRMLLSVGGTEAAYLEPSKDFDAALRSRNVHSTLLLLPGQNHQDAVNSLADSNSPLFAATLELLQRGAPQR